jgi:hypothetical protein
MASTQAWTDWPFYHLVHEAVCAYKRAATPFSQDAISSPYFGSCPLPTTAGLQFDAFKHPFQIVNGWRPRHERLLSSNVGHIIYQVGG